MAFERKPPGSGCRSPKTGVCCAFDFLQRCNPLEEAVTLQEMTSLDLRRPEVTSFDRKSPGSGCRSKTGVYCAFYFIQDCCSQEEAVSWQEMTLRNFRWPEVTRKWRHLTGSHLEAVADLGFLEGEFRFRRIMVIAGLFHHGRQVCLCRSAPIRAKRAKFSEFRTFDLASAGFSGPIQRALVRRSSKLLHQFHHPCGADSFLLFMAKPLVKLTITSQWPCRQILPHCISHWMYL